MKACPSCGTLNQDTNSSCALCGFSLTGVQPGLQTVQKTTDNTTTTVWGYTDCPICGEKLPNYDPQSPWQYPHMVEAHPRWLSFQRTQNRLGKWVLLPLLFLTILAIPISIIVGYLLAVASVLSLVTVGVSLRIRFRRGLKRTISEWRTLHGEPSGLGSSSVDPIGERIPWQEVSTGKPSSLEEGDAGILAVVTELVQQLKIKQRWPATRVSWKNIIPKGRTSQLVHSDIPIIDLGELILAERTKGKLEPEEWRPLIASSLIYTKATRSLFRHLFFRLFLPVTALFGLLFFALLLAYDALQAFSISAVTLDIFSSMLISLVLTKIFSPPYVRKVRLLSDRLASDVVGKDAFLHSLSVIEKQGFNDIIHLEARNFRYRFASEPKLSARASNLRSYLSSQP